MEGGGIWYDRYRKPGTKANGKDNIKFFPKNKLILKNVTFEGNTALEIGGALRVTDVFLHGTSVELGRDVKFVNNAAPKDKDGSFGVPYTFIDCQAGYYTIQDLNLLGESFDISIGCPKKCLPGSFGKGVARRIALESCEVCPLGSYCGNSGTIMPTICPKGYYCKPDDASDGEGIFYATPCPDSYYGETIGLSSKTCTGLCPIGHYCTKPTIIPRKCSRGTYSDKAGSVECKECPEGRSTPESAKINGGAILCEKCGVGFFSDTKRLAMCSICECFCFFCGFQAFCSPYLFSSFVYFQVQPVGIKKK